MPNKIIQTFFILIALCTISNAQLLPEQRSPYSISEIDSIFETLSEEVVVDTVKINALLESSYKLKYSKGIINCHSLLGEHYYLKFSLKEGQVHFEKQLAEATRIGDKREESTALGQLASVLKEQEKLVEAVEKSHLQLSIAKELNDSILICNAYLTLSEIHNIGVDYDAELKNLLLSLDYHTDDNLGLSKAHLYSILGSIYFSKDDSINAHNYFTLADDAFKKMDPADILDEAHFNLYYGRFLLQSGNPKAAVVYCNKASKYFSRIGSKQNTAECLTCLIEGYHKLNEKKQVERYTDSLEILVEQFSNPYINYILRKTQFKNYDFSEDELSVVFNYIKSFEDIMIDEKRSQISQTEKQLELKESENKLLISESKLERKRQERNWYILLTILILTASLFLLNYFLNERKIKQKSIEILKLKEEQKSIELENKLKQNKLLTQKLDDSERSAVIKTTLIKEFNNKLEDIKTELSKIKFMNQSNDRQTLQHVVRRLDSELDSEDSFIGFLDHFNTVYPQFFEHLQSQFPTLNIHDKKLCAYIKMNLESNEIAKLLNINKSSVNTARYRLRKKLNLLKSKDLNQFIHNI